VVAQAHGTPNRCQHARWRRQYRRTAIFGVRPGRPWRPRPGCAGRRGRPTGRLPEDP
jgi:hypothetical protein